MARIRNPRFAPEFLERRLNPSELIPTTFAEVARMDDPEPLPPDQPGCPAPLPPPTEPTPILPG